MALGRGQPGVQNRDPMVGKSPDQAPPGLRSQGNLRHQHQGDLSRGDDSFDEPNVHLRLARSGHTEQQVSREPTIERIADPLDDGFLGAGERFRDRGIDRLLHPRRFDRATRAGYEHAAVNQACDRGGCAQAG